MMKKILKLKSALLVILSIVAFSSCAVDDDATLATSSLENLEISVESPFTRLPTGTTIVNVPFNLSNVVTQLARVTYTVDGQEFTQDVNTGGTTVNVPVDMTGATFRQVVITGFQMLYEEADGFQTVVSENNTANLVIGDDVLAILSWTEAVDIDLALVSGDPGSISPPLVETNANIVDLSISTTNTELVVLPANSDDGSYVVAIVPFAGFNTPITFELLVIADDVYTFTPTLDSGLAATGGFFAPIAYPTVLEAANIVQSTDGSGTVSYAVTEL